jgi:hypothetical protein
MALGSNQPQTEMSTGNLLGGKAWPARKTDNLVADLIRERLVLMKFHIFTRDSCNAGCLPWWMDYYAVSVA